MASPLVYPGQRVQAVVRAEKANTAAVNARLCLKVYGPDDRLVTADGPSVELQPGQERTIDWVIPDSWDSLPIQQLGLVLSVPEGGRRVDGTVWLDRLGWKGPPRLTLKRPEAKRLGQFWHRAWVNGVTTFQTELSGASFCIAQNSGEGIIIYGTRDWTDYRVAVPRLVVNLGSSAGVAVRMQGLNRYFSVMFLSGPRRIALVKARDEQRTELASALFDWKLDMPYEVSVSVHGKVITGCVSGDGPGIVLEAVDEEYAGGGIGLVVTDGSVSANQSMSGR
ncbi:hypothetical protein VTN77DRAFT_6246 [Rasamsonia byssochlamydoides]|uniref:uncharacterized protein n=1 Tax=Rasamsonia byssochlamydoides TaxID=89139 RepID=UPI0037426F86